MSFNQIATTASWTQYQVSTISRATPTIRTEKLLPESFKVHEIDYLTPHALRCLLALFKNSSWRKISLMKCLNTVLNLCRILQNKTSDDSATFVRKFYRFIKSSSQHSLKGWSVFQKCIALQKIFPSSHIGGDAMHQKAWYPDGHQAFWRFPKPQVKFLNRFYLRLSLDIDPHHTNEIRKVLSMMSSL